MELPLTKKQKAICDLVTEGLSNKEIGLQVGISVRTVEAHRENIFRKVGVRNAVELTRKLLGA